jgi:hypothetical protein
LGEISLAMAFGKPAVMVAFACALCAASSYAQAIGDLVGSDATVTGSVVLAAAGTRVLSGTSITAKDTAASLKLARGGELRICPHSTVSLTASKGGRDLNIGMGTGAIETHYSLASSADTILTPDFRILLPGPGVFQFAVAADARGNTCVRSLPGNSASMVVTEVMGDGVYQVRSGDQIVFHNGRVSETDPLVPPDCGCGPPQAPIQTAENSTAPAANKAAPQLASPSPPKPITQAPPAQPAIPASQRQTSLGVTRPGPRLGSIPGANPEPASGAYTAPSVGLPGPGDSAPNLAVMTPETHIQVDAPFVFRGEEPTLPPPPIVAVVSVSQMPDLIVPVEQPLPPPATPVPAPVSTSNPRSDANEPRHAGFFSKLGTFFGSIFGRHR